MPIIRYSHCDRSDYIAADDQEIEFSDNPFVDMGAKYFTDYTRIVLPDGFFVCGHEKACPGYRINMPTSGSYFHWCADGKGTYNGMPFKKNDVFVVYKGTQKNMIADSDDPWEIYWCVWKGGMAEAAAARLSNYNDRTIYSLENGIDLSSLFNFLIYQPHREQRIAKVVNGFVDILLSDCRIVQKNTRGHVKDTRAKTIADIQSYINSNFIDTSVEKIADAFHYNRKYITRIFHEYTGVTMCDYITEVKLQRAEVLLTTTQLSIEEIAFHSGYSSYSSFIKAFKRKNGITPSEFIKFSSEV